MKVAQFVLSDPGLETLGRLAEQEAGRDATTYLHGLVLIPLFIVVLLLGELDTLIDAGSAGTDSIFALWNAVPAWFWAASLTLTRLLNVALVVCSVYVTYRIGTELMDRRAGRIAAVFTTLSLAVIHTAHEVNEDTPALFLLLVVLYLSIRYLHTENRQYFVVGCGLGGLAIAFKLTAGVVVVFLGVAYFLTGLKKSDPIAALWQPRLLLFGLLLGIITIYVGIPNLLLRGPEWLIEARLLGENQARTVASTTPRGYSALLAYLNGLGLPLAIGTAAGLFATVRRFLTERTSHDGEVVLFVGLVVYFVLFFGVWREFNTHHVLPSIPLLVILFAVTLSQYFEDRADIARVVLAVVLLTTALYAGAGLYQFTNDPRDEATEWLESEAPPEATITVFDNSPAHVGLVHGRPIDHYQFGRAAAFPGEEYTEWLLSTPDRNPEYIVTTGNIRGTGEYLRRAEFNDRLMNGDHYGYVVAAEFGERPQSRSRSSELLRAGIEPKLEKRKDYSIIFARNESLANPQQ